VLEEQGSLIVLLESAGGEALAFATAQPSGDERANALVRYFAVHPRAWGEQFGARLARALPQALRDLGFERAWLLVYPDNERAVRLYERNGWRATGETSVNPRSGRQMMRYELRL
jgi:ribosomal protein S18 acetylase RimI-like enzyme